MDKTLYDYLKNVVSLEKSLYTQNKAINQMEEEIEVLGIPNSYTKPQRPQQSSNFSVDGLKTFTMLGGFVGGIVGLFCGGFLAGIAIGVLVGIVLMIIIDSVCDNSEDKKRDEQYEMELLVYNLEVDEDEKRVERELTEKARLEEIMSMMDEKRNNTEALLKEYYETGIVFPKYRNLIAMCSILEYFMSGACDTMKEAYNKYDNEVLFKQVMTKLDEVIQALDSIRENQFMLYDAIQEGNRISQQLVDESVRQAELIEQSIDYQVLEANYTRQIANEMKFQNQLLIYDSWQRNRLN